MCFPADWEAQIGSIFGVLDLSALESELYTAGNDSKNRRFDINNVQRTGLAPVCPGVFYIPEKIFQIILKNSSPHPLGGQYPIGILSERDKKVAHNQLDGKEVNSNGAIFFL